MKRRLILCLALVAACWPGLSRGQETETARPRDPWAPGPVMQRVLAWAGDYEWGWDGQMGAVVFDDPVFKEFFGNDYFPVARSSLNWYPIDNLSLGVGTGLMYESGRAIGEISGEASGEESDFWVFPLRADLRYRFKFSEDQGIVPSVWGGGDWWYFYEKNSGADDVSGDKTGYHWGADLAFLLDPLDPGSARRLQQEFGVGNTYFTLGYEAQTVGADETGIDFSGWAILAGVRFESGARE